MRGVYSIQNRVNGNEYIGCSRQIIARWHNHRKDLRAGTHHSPYLQRAWNYHGENAFEFAIITRVPRNVDVVAVERQLITERKPAYNCMVPDAGNGGWTHAHTTKMKLSASARNQWKDPEYIRKQEPYLAERRRVKKVYADYQHIRGRLATLKQRILLTHLSHNGETLHKDEWARRLRISRDTLAQRLTKFNGDLRYVLGPYTYRPPRYNYPKPRNTDIMLTHKGETKTLAEWADIVGIKKTTLDRRLRAGWSVERALCPVDKPWSPHAVDLDGELVTYAEAARRLGVSYTTVAAYIRQGKQLSDIERDIDGRVKKSNGGRRAKLYEVDGVTKTLAEWAEDARCSVQTFYTRINRAAYPATPESVVAELVHERRQKRRWAACTSTAHKA